MRLHRYFRLSREEANMVRNMRSTEGVVVSFRGKPLHEMQLMGVYTALSYVEESYPEEQARAFVGMVPSDPHKKRLAYRRLMNAVDSVYFAEEKAEEEGSSIFN